MSRPQKKRRICTPPKMIGFKPFGIPSCIKDVISLSFEEYESFRLVEYEKLPQNKAAEQMNISRPTLTRIYNKALTTIAKAFIEGKTLIIEGGNYEMDKDWYRCRKCHKLIDGIENHIKCKNCTSFNKEELIKLTNKE